MRLSLARKFSLAHLLAFIANLGNWGFNVERLAHEYEHYLVSPGSTSSQFAGDTDRAPEREADHDRLHAVGQLQPCPLSAFDWAPLVVAGMVSSVFITFPVAPAIGEPPFRPPRGLSAFA